MEQRKVKIFYKPIDGGELKELECIGKVEGLDFEPLKEPIDVKYDPTPVTNSLSFDIDASKCNIRKLFYVRIPRKLKKKAKKWIAVLAGKSVKDLRYNYRGTLYLIK